MAHYPIPGGPGAPTVGGARRKPLPKSPPGGGPDANPQACLIKAPTFQVNLPVVGNVGPGVGGFCILSKTEARAIMGFLVITAGSVVLLVGGVILATWGLQKSQAAGKAAEVAAVIPGGQPAAAALYGAQKKINSKNAKTAARKQKKKGP